MRTLIKASLLRHFCPQLATQVARWITFLSCNVSLSLSFDLLMSQNVEMQETCYTRQRLKTFLAALREALRSTSTSRNDCSNMEIARNFCRLQGIYRTRKVIVQLLSQQNYSQVAKKYLE